MTSYSDTLINRSFNLNNRVYTSIIDTSRNLYSNSVVISNIIILNGIRHNIFRTNVFIDGNMDAITSNTGTLRLIGSDFKIYDNLNVGGIIQSDNTTDVLDSNNQIIEKGVIVAKDGNFNIYGDILFGNLYIEPNCVTNLSNINISQDVLINANITIIDLTVNKNLYAGNSISNTITANSIILDKISVSTANINNVNKTIRRNGLKILSDIVNTNTITTYTIDPNYLLVNKLTVFTDAKFNLNSNIKKMHNELDTYIYGDIYMKSNLDLFNTDNIIIKNITKSNSIYSNNTFINHLIANNLLKTNYIYIVPFYSNILISNIINTSNLIISNITTNTLNINGNVTIKDNAIKSDIIIDANLLLDTSNNNSGLILRYNGYNESILYTNTNNINSNIMDCFIVGNISNNFMYNQLSNILVTGIYGNIYSNIFYIGNFTSNIIIGNTNKSSNVYILDNSYGNIYNIYGNLIAQYFISNNILANSIYSNIYTNNKIIFTTSNILISNIDISNFNINNIRNNTCNITNITISNYIQNPYIYGNSIIGNINSNNITANIISNTINTNLLVSNTIFCTYIPDESIFINKTIEYISDSTLNYTNLTGNIIVIDSFNIKHLNLLNGSNNNNIKWIYRRNSYNKGIYVYLDDGIIKINKPLYKIYFIENKWINYNDFDFFANRYLMDININPLKIISSNYGELLFCELTNSINIYINNNNNYQLNQNINLYNKICTNYTNQYICVINTNVVTGVFLYENINNMYIARKIITGSIPNFVNFNMSPDGNKIIVCTNIINYYYTTDNWTTIQFSSINIPIGSVNFGKKIIFTSNFEVVISDNLFDGGNGSVYFYNIINNNILFNYKLNGSSKEQLGEDIDYSQNGILIISAINNDIKGTIYVYKKKYIYNLMQTINIQTNKEANQGNNILITKNGNTIYYTIKNLELNKGCIVYWLWNGSKYIYENIIEGEKENYLGTIFSGSKDGKYIFVNKGNIIRVYH